jgi:hypothetical protein
MEAAQVTQGRHAKAHRKSGGSRVGNGSKLLPTMDARSVWARIMGDTIRMLTNHLGGEENLTETLRMTCRRVATMESELCFLEDSFARLRSQGEVPKPADIDLYSRLSNTQRRMLEILGFDRKPRDITEHSATLRATIIEAKAVDLEELP